MDKKMYLSIVVALATVAAVWLAILLATPIAKPMAWALIIGVATFSHHARLADKFPSHPNRTAGMMVLAVTVCLILPVASLIVMVAQNVTDWYAEGERLVQAFTTMDVSILNQYPLAHEIIILRDKFGIDLSGFAAKIATRASGYILDLTTNTAKSLGELFFTIAVALFMLFFIYRDGEKVLASAVSKFAANQTKTHRLLSEIRATTVAVTVGTIFACLVQGTIAGVGYFVAGLPAPVLCGALTAITALVPVVGTAIVWMPLAAFIAFNGAYMKAVLLVIWCLVFVGLSDNAIRPLAIGAKSDIPVPAIVLGAICGVFALGVLGLILGPVLFSVIITLWQDLTNSDVTETSDEANVNVIISTTNAGNNCNCEHHDSF